MIRADMAIAILTDMATVTAMVMATTTETAKGNRHKLSMCYSAY